MRFTDFEKLDLVQRDFVLSDWARRGRPVIVDRYHDPSTGRMFDLDRDGRSYRETPATKDQWEIVPFGPWQKLADE